MLQREALVKGFADGSTQQKMCHKCQIVFDIFHEQISRLCSVLTAFVLVLLHLVRLVGGSHRCEGRLEVQYNGRWGTVCDDKWDMVDADVVCRQLGCGSSEWLNSRFGPGTGPILLDDVGCTGNETSISECPNLGWNVHNCSHYEDVSLTCKGMVVLLTLRWLGVL